MGSFSFSANGVWIISFYLATLVSSPPSGTFGVYAYQSPNAACSAPLLTTNSGSAPNIVCFASNCFVTNYISSTITYTMFLSIDSGSVYTNYGASYVTVTRIA